VETNWNSTVFICSLSFYSVFCTFTTGAHLLLLAPSRGSFRSECCTGVESMAALQITGHFQGRRRAVEWRGHCPPDLSKGGATEAEVPFHNIIIGNFTVYHDRLQTNSLQLFAHPENSEWLSISFYHYFWVSELFLHRNKHNW